MKQFDIAQSFIERCERALRGAEIAAALEQTLQTLGFRCFACWSHVDPLRPPRRAVMLHNYPLEWVQCFIELEFDEIDPVFHWANRTPLPFFWDSERFRAELTSHEAASSDLNSKNTSTVHRAAWSSRPTRLPVAGGVNETALLFETRSHSLVAVEAVSEAAAAKLQAFYRRSVP